MKAEIVYQRNPTYACLYLCTGALSLWETGQIAVVICELLVQNNVSAETNQTLISLIEVPAAPVCKAGRMIINAMQRKLICK